MPYAVWNNYDAKYFALTLTDVSVTRNFSATVKEEYKAQTIIGEMECRQEQLIHWNQMYSMTCTL